MKKVYIYLHKNGTLIDKPAAVCETNTTPYEYFDSPFVQNWWKVEDEEDLMTALEEAKDMGASEEETKKMLLKYSEY